MKTRSARVDTITEHKSFLMLKTKDILFYKNRFLQGFDVNLIRRQGHNDVRWHVDSHGHKDKLYLYLVTCRRDVRYGETEK